LGDLIDSLALPYSERARALVDFGGARAQVDGAWPNGDLGNPNRRFRYALTHLAPRNGRCTTLDDADGYVDVADAVTRLDVHVTLWDPVGNVSEHTESIGRDPGSVDAPRRLVTFEVEGATTYVGENVYVSGDAAQLGAWTPRRAAKLAPVSYPTWRGSAWLPVGASVQLKFTKIAPSQHEVPWGFEAGPEPLTTWEGGGNRSFLVPAEPAVAIVHGIWQR
jgi:hypothetical protein